MDAHLDVSYQMVFDFHLAFLFEYAYTPNLLPNHNTAEEFHERPRADLASRRTLNDDYRIRLGRISSRTQTGLSKRSLLRFFSFVTIVHIVDVFVAASSTSHWHSLIMFPA